MLPTTKAYILIPIEKFIYPFKKKLNYKQEVGDDSDVWVL